MQSILSRANTLLFYGVTCLFLVFAAVAVSDTFNFPSPTFEAQVLDINRFRNKPDGDDEVSLMLQISADLESLFTFNTKQVFVFVAAEYETAKNRLNQVSLWDDILTSKEKAKFQIRVNNKYRFVDQGSNLRGKEFNLTLHWHVMPKTGRMLAGKIVSPGYCLPVAYK